MDKHNIQKKRAQWKLLLEKLWKCWKDAFGKSCQAKATVLSALKKNVI